MALLDTNVLWPSLQRDFLLSLGIERLYRPLWSDVILEELEFHESLKLARRGADQADAQARAARLVEQMRNSFGDALVTGWEGLEGSYGLPDPDDEHVVAAAVVGGAGAIVTHNIKDFPEAKIPGSLQVLKPAEFLTNTVAVDPMRAWKAIDEISRRSGRKGPGVTPDEVLETLASRYGLDEVVAYIRDHA